MYLNNTQAEQRHSLSQGHTTRLQTRRFLRLLCITAPCILVALILRCASPECAVENLGIFVHPDSDDIVGLDGCASIPLDEHRVLWTFGDTIIGRFTEKQTAASTFENSAVMNGMISNSIAETPLPDDGTIENLRFAFYRLHGAPREFLPPKGNGKGHRRIWPVDGIRIGDRVYVYYIGVRTNPGSPEPFRVTGTGIASWHSRDGGFGMKNPDFRFLATLFGPDEPVFGDSVILHEGNIYLIGHKKSGRHVHGYFSRVSPDMIESRSHYQFLGGDGRWTRSSGKAGKFFGDISGEPSLSYNKNLRCYVVIFCSLTGCIKAAVFRSFGDLPSAVPFVVYTPPKLKKIESRQFMFYYSGKEVFSTDENIYAIYINPSIYQPVLLRIPLCVLRSAIKG